MVFSRLRVETIWTHTRTRFRPNSGGSPHDRHEVEQEESRRTFTSGGYRNSAHASWPHKHRGHLYMANATVWYLHHKSGYYAASTKNLTPLDATTETFEWNKDVWSAKCSPKMKLFLWSVVQEAIPLGEQLQKRGINSDVRCIKCKGS